jgi:hypothetical protein
MSDLGQLRRCEGAPIGLGSSGNPKDAIELRRLLRMRGERPRHRAADKRNEISPFHDNQYHSIWLIAL